MTAATMRPDIRILSAGDCCAVLERNSVGRLAYVRSGFIDIQPIGYATNVVIREENDSSGQPRVITVTGRGSDVDLRLQFDVGSMVVSPMNLGAPRTQPREPLASEINFLQMRGTYTVTGRAGARQFNVTAPGSAETFRGRTP